MITWLQSIHLDLQTAEYFKDTAGLYEFHAQCCKIAQKSLQHFIYTRTGNFPLGDDLLPLFQQATKIEKKLKPYRLGIQSMDTVGHIAVPHEQTCYPSETTREHYLDFCRELFDYIIKLLEQ